MITPTNTMNSIYTQLRTGVRPMVKTLALFGACIISVTAVNDYQNPYRNPNYRPSAQELLKNVKHRRLVTMEGLLSEINEAKHKFENPISSRYLTSTRRRLAVTKDDDFLKQLLNAFGEGGKIKLSNTYLCESCGQTKKPDCTDANCDETKGYEYMLRVCQVEGDVVGPSPTKMGWRASKLASFLNDNAPAYETTWKGHLEKHIAEISEKCQKVVDKITPHSSTTGLEDETEKEELMPGAPDAVELRTEMKGVLQCPTCFKLCSEYPRKKCEDKKFHELSVPLLVSGAVKYPEMNGLYIQMSDCTFKHQNNECSIEMEDKWTFYNESGDECYKAYDEDAEDIPPTINSKTQWTLTGKPRPDLKVEVQPKQWSYILSQSEQLFEMMKRSAQVEPAILGNRLLHDIPNRFGLTDQKFTTELVGILNEMHNHHNKIINAKMSDEDKKIAMNSTFFLGINCHGNEKDLCIGDDYGADFGNSVLENESSSGKDAIAKDVIKNIILGIGETKYQYTSKIGQHTRKFSAGVPPESRVVAFFWSCHAGNVFNLPTVCKPSGWKEDRTRKEEGTAGRRQILSFSSSSLGGVAVGTPGTALFQACVDQQVDLAASYKEMLNTMYTAQKKICARNAAIAENATEKTTYTAKEYKKHYSDVNVGLYTNTPKNNFNAVWGKSIDSGMRGGRKYVGGKASTLDKEEVQSLRKSSIWTLANSLEKSWREEAARKRWTNCANLLKAARRFNK